MLLGSSSITKNLRGLNPIGMKYPRNFTYCVLNGDFNSNITP